MAHDSNGAPVHARAFVRIARTQLYYGGTVAMVTEVHPFHAATVEMFNGKLFRMSTRDMTLEPRT